ncbi:hypothetical protein GPLA_2771 [Paraglaciecola polaris LMG 21857]|uniref:Uncharacterized protein n=1 Tax=Paraglaciecola polaris LMG 21857 TaxID=1129793 RepID=K7AEB4_9ALTE|nr:hypothetical protein GPLA_2771 [Paraglaciecola polaris LMG 21857]
MAGLNTQRSAKLWLHILFFALLVDGIYLSKMRNIIMTPVINVQK